MQTHELLDRLEILNPTNSFFSDLRKTVLDDDKYALFRIIQKHTDSQLVEGLRKLKDDETFVADSFSRGQLQSKIWVIEELKKLDIDLGTVFLCAGWYATLATMIFESGITVGKIRSFDIDDSCRHIAETFNKPWVLQDWRFKTATYNILDIDYNNFVYNVLRSDGSVCELTDGPDTIINTSCEHIANFKEWYDKIPKGKLMVLQSNNYFDIEDHVNCVSGPLDFEKQSPMTTILYQGALELSKYTRFMRIGIK